MRFEREKPKEVSAMPPSSGRTGKRGAKRWRLGEVTVDRHVEQTERKRMTSKQVSRRLEIRSRSSLGSWVQSAIADFPGKVMEKKQTEKWLSEEALYIKVEGVYSNGLFSWATSS